MVNVIISGALGRMGKAIADIIAQEEYMKVVAGVDVTEDANLGFPVFKSISDVKEKADIIIDFSIPEALKDLCGYAIENKTALVVGTTGLEDKHREYLHNTSKSVAVLASNNMSLGTAVFTTLVKTAAKLLPDYDIEIVERHHNKKIDSPSGTALMIADAVREVRPDAVNVYDRSDKIGQRQRNEIGIFGVRAGNMVGEHRVIIGGEDETIELVSLVTSRRILAAGAVKAAKFVIKQKPGYYTLQDILDGMLKNR